MKRYSLPLIGCGLMLGTLLISCNNSPTQSNSSIEQPTASSEGSPREPVTKQTPRTISVKSPKTNFKCEKKEENKCFFTVKGIASNLQKGDYLSLLLKIPSGETWWQGGESIKYQDDFSADWVISFASFDPSKNSNFTAVVIATTSPLGSGGTWDNIPANVGKSPIYQWELQQ
jgi:hypothetical protein